MRNSPSQFQKLSCLSAAVAFAAVLNTSAATFTSWDFSGAAGNEATYGANGGDSANFDVSGTVIGRAPGFGGVAAPGKFAANWGGGVIDAHAAYFTFDINPLPGTTFTIDSINVTADMPTYYIWSSIGGFPIEDPFNPGFTDLSAIPPVFVPDGTTVYNSAITFHITLIGNESPNGGLSDLSINGRVITTANGNGIGVPETLPVWSLGLAVLTFLAGHNFLQRRNAGLMATRK